MWEMRFVEELKSKDICQSVFLWEVGEWGSTGKTSLLSNPLCCPDSERMQPALENTPMLQLYFAS